MTRRCIPSRILSGPLSAIATAGLDASMDCSTPRRAPLDVTFVFGQRTRKPRYPRSVAARAIHVIDARRRSVDDLVITAGTSTSRLLGRGRSASCISAAAKAVARGRASSSTRRPPVYLGLRASSETSGMGNHDEEFGRQNWSPSSTTYVAATQS